MKHCPAADCSYRVKHGIPAEFVDSAEVCSDCGAPLTDGAAPVASSTAQVPGGGHAAARRALTPAVGRPLAVTLLAAVAAAAGHAVPLPFVNMDVLGASGEGVQGLLNIVPTQLSVFALGVGPWLTSFMVVELLALAIPSLKPLRLRPAGRQTLNKASIALGLVIAAVQTWMLMSWLSSMTSPFAEEPLLTDFGLDGGLVGAVLIGVSFGLVILAGAVEGRGLIGGFSTLMLGFFLWHALLSAGDVMVGLQQMGTTTTDGLLGAIVAAGGVAVGWFGTGLDDGDRIPRPAAGTIGISWAASVMMLPTTWASLTDGEMPMDLLPGTWRYMVLYGTVALGITAGMTWLLYTPARTRKQLAGLGGGFELPSALGRALLFTAVVTGLGFVPQGGSAWISALVFLTLGAIGRDLWEALQHRRERPDLVAAWPLHRLHLVGPALTLLQDAGIPASARGLHHRVLGQVFTPWVPVDIMVPADDVERTRTLLDERLPRT